LHLSRSPIGDGIAPALPRRHGAAIFALSMSFDTPPELHAVPIFWAVLASVVVHGMALGNCRIADVQE
jgi:hypothetical protein